MIRVIGGGSYGEVWLAKNALGNYHAVKVVRRNKFKNEKPFEREFEGLKKFTPISREHPSFVHILHVGLNPKLGYFYYIMELADNENQASQKTPDAYAPLTLNSILTKYRKLPLPQCLQLGLGLSSALDYLHRQGLIHRDLKPPNIIYVKGKPKLADIGLVTDIAASNSSLSSIGTLGYMAPEGAGTPAADIYSLGKVLYQACMGRLPTQYPYPRSTLLEGEADPNLLRMNEIILKACEADVQRRYPSAAALHDDLAQVQRTLPGEK
jgi:serine/threonine protein kinase